MGTKPGAAPPTRPVPQVRPLDLHVLLEVWMPQAPQVALALPAPLLTSQPQEPAAQQIMGRLATPMLALAMQAPPLTPPRSAQLARVRALTKPGAAPPTRPVPQERPVDPHVLLEVWMSQVPQVALVLPAPPLTSQPQEPAVMLSRLLLRQLQLLLRQLQLLLRM